MDEDLIITQMGLIFSQTRYIRMALESLERSAMRYAGVALDVAAAGPRQWGAPPMEAGALRVYIVNIADLIPEQGGLLGFLSSVFRLVTSGVAGVVGGVLSGLALPVILAEIAAITSNVVQILRMTGFSGSETPQSAAHPQESSGTVASFLTRIETTADRLANILGLANAQQASGTAQATPESSMWLRTLETASRIVDGLILLVPNLIGAFASLLVRIDQLKIGILDILEFLVRNVLILRGMALLTIYDTIGAAARLAGVLLGLVANAASGLLGALFRMLESLLAGIMAAIGFLSAAVTSMVNQLLPWLVTTVFSILESLGRTPIFRLMFAFVEVLPEILPHLLSLVGEAMSPRETSNLTDARDRMIAGLTAATSPPTIALMPDFANDTRVQVALGAASASVMGVASTIQTEVTGMLQTSSGLMTNIAGAMRDAIGPNGEGLTRNLQTMAGPVVRNAEELSRQLRTARDTARQTRGTELDAIATAYEQWLTGHGLENILSEITHYFQTAPAASGGVLQRAAEAATPSEPPRPTVEISEVTIQIVAAAPERAPAAIPAAHQLGARSFDPDLDLDEEELYARGLPA